MCPLLRGPRNGKLKTVFRRRNETAEAQTVTEPEEPTGKAYTPRKGQPTPKRRDVEANRRRAVTAPKNRKEAARQMRERNARERKVAESEAAKGNDRYLPARDRGAAKSLTRDLIDSRRTISQYFMFLSIAIVLVAMVPVPQIQMLIYYFWVLMMAVVIVEGYLNGRRAKRLVNERLPEESTRGIAMYAAMRALMIRKLRMPKPRVKVGEPV
jgi:hypothetical protein